VRRTRTYRDRLAEPAFRLETAWTGQAGRLRALYGELLGQELTEVKAPPGPDTVSGLIEQLAGA
jgi:hypothetical protein